MAKRQGDSARSAERMRRAVETGDRERFYLLHGDDDFSRERLAAWLDQELAPEAVDFNADGLIDVSGVITVGEPSVNSLAGTIVY